MSSDKGYFVGNASSWKSQIADPIGGQIIQGLNVDELLALAVKPTELNQLKAVDLLGTGVGDVNGAVYALVCLANKNLGPNIEQRALKGLLQLYPLAKEQDQILRCAIDRARHSYSTSAARSATVLIAKVNGIRLVEVVNDFNQKRRASRLPPICVIP